MSIPSQKQNPVTSESVTAQNPGPGQNNSEPQFTVPGALPDSKPATQETLHLGTHKAEPIEPDDQVPAIKAAAKGDDDVMSQPQKQHS